MPIARDGLGDEPTEVNGELRRVRHVVDVAQARDVGEVASGLASRCRSIWRRVVEHSSGSPTTTPATTYALTRQRPRSCVTGSAC